MKNLYYRGFLSAICLASVLAAFTRVDAGPIRFDQVVQVINAQPGRADTTSFTKLRMVNDYSFLISGDDDDDKDKKNGTSVPQTQDGRVITETKTDIVMDDVCDCEEDVVKRGFPKWALLGLAAIPIAFILIKRKKDTPTPTPYQTPSVTPTPTPGITPTPTPGITPTPTPVTTPTPPPTPVITPTPPPEPVPEPMTILLFGTGLASIGLAARKKFGKKGKGDDTEDEEN